MTMPVRTLKEDRTRTEAARGDKHPTTAVDRQADETPEAWPARLQTVSQECRTMFMRSSYLHSSWDELHRPV
jgi:hypothetical protein